MAQVPPFTVRFESPTRVGEQPVEHRLTAPALQVEARMPPGVENLSGRLVSRELDVHQTWQPRPQKVAPGPAANADAALAVDELPRWVWLWWIVGGLSLLAIAAAATYRARSALLAVWKRRRAQRHGSGAGLFARLLEACRAGDAKATYNALLRWLDSTHHGPDTATIEGFLAYYPDTELRRQVEALQESFLGRTADWDGAALANTLQRLCRKHPHWRTMTHEAQLPVLNPPRVAMMLVVACIAGLAGSTSGCRDEPS